MGGWGELYPIFFLDQLPNSHSHSHYTRSSPPLPMLCLRPSPLFFVCLFRFLCDLPNVLPHKDFCKWLCPSFTSL